MKCSIEGCESQAKARGLCNKHWYRWYRNGNPEKVQAVRYKEDMSLKEHLMARTNITDTCWIWKGTILKSYGYGTVTIRGVKHRAHRLSWEVHNGPIPEGLSVLHVCDNTACVNPKHLFLGTQADNIRDMHIKERAKFGLPPSRNRGETHGLSKLKKEDVLAIRKSDLSNKELAEKHGVHPQTIVVIKARKSWRHI